MNKKERFAPKIERLKALQSKGIILHTVWNFEDKRCGSCKRKAIITYPHFSGLDLCCDCWRSWSKKQQLVMTFEEKC